MDDPYDFATQYRKILKEAQEKKKRTEERKKAKCKKKSIQSDVKTELDVKTESIIKSPRLGRRQKLKETVVNSTVTSSASSSESVNEPQDCQQKLNNTQTVGIPNTHENTTNTRRKRRKQYDLSSCRVIGPTICIGDFYDSYNMSFTKIPKINITDEDIMFIPQGECSLAELNRIMNIKVYWRKIRTHSFPIRMFQSIASIYDHFSKLEDIDKSHICLKLHGKILQSTDTPDSMDYKISDFIDGELEFYKSEIYDTSNANKEENQSEDLEEVKFHIMNKDTKEPNANEEEEQSEESEKVKFYILQKNVKERMLFSIKKSDKMLILYIKVAEKLGLEVKSFTLLLDGDPINWNDTIVRLDLEGDECFELYEKNTKNTLS